MDYTRREAIKACEAVLSQIKTEYIDGQICPTAVRIIERMLDRSHELEAAFQDIFEATNTSRHHIYQVFDSLLMAAINWNPTATKETRDNLSKVREINAKISETAFELSSLLDDLEEISRAHSTAYYDPISLIEAAGSENHLFVDKIKQDLSHLCHQFDGKYWPSLPEILDELGERFADARAASNDPISEAAVKKSRHSKADSFRAMFKHVDGNKGQSPYNLDPDFHLKDESWASLANCILDLECDELADGAYIKRLRQRMRNE